jgi:fluoride exporter
MNFLLVFIGGGLGSVLRYQIGVWLQKTSSSLPWATFIANLSACLVFAGVLWILSLKTVSESSLKTFLLIGFCGGLSTFSSFGYETFLLFKQGLDLIALLNIFFNTTICLLIFYFAYQKLI